jgi:hypothetical protein
MATDLISIVGVGAAFTEPVLIYYDTVFEKAKRRGETWAKSEEPIVYPLHASVAHSA